MKILQAIIVTMILNAESPDGFLLKIELCFERNFGRSSLVFTCSQLFPVIDLLTVERYRSQRGLVVGYGYPGQWHKGKLFRVVLSIVYCPPKEPSQGLGFVQRHSRLDVQFLVD